MLAIKNFVQQKLMLLHFAVTFLLLVSCGNHVFDTQIPEFASVTFCNDSSYRVTIHQTNFSGIVLAELIPAECLSANVSPSNNYGIGSVFSVEYWHLIENDVWVGGKDPNRQITQNLEDGKRYFISIPQPKNLDLQESFIKIVNASSMDLELTCLSLALYPVNGELSVPSLKSGLYSGNNIKTSACFSDDKIKGLTVKQGKTYPFPEFAAVNGYIHNFRFDGNEVIQTEEEKIIRQ
ncbi:hypothetical protein R83H12_01213 [Fibrobacteria bacterium R8-3-H12]